MVNNQSMSGWAQFLKGMRSHFQRLPLLSRGVMLVLSGVFWGIGTFCLLLTMPLFLMSIRLFWVWLITGAVLGALGGYIHYRPIRRLVSVSIRTWIIASAVGLGIGLTIGSLLAIDLNPTSRQMDPFNYTSWLGWSSYYSRTLMVGISGYGFAQWLILRRSIKFSVWLVPAATVLGYITGALLGDWTDEVIVSMGITSNGFGERFMGASLTGFPVAFAILGTVWGALLSLALIQYSLQHQGWASELDPVSLKTET